MDYRIEQLRFKVREDPSSRHFYQLGELLRRHGELDEAVEVLRAGLEHHREYVAAWVSLGRALFQGERYDEARSAFSRALELDRENAVAAGMLGRAAARTGDWAAAAESLGLASELVPSDEDLAAEAETARSHLHSGDSGEAPVPAEGSPVPGEGEPSGTDGTEPPPDGSFDAAAGERVEGTDQAVVPRPRELTFLSEDDPFLTLSSGDTDVFDFGDDVFAIGAVTGVEPPEPAGVPDEVFGAAGGGEAVETGSVEGGPEPAGLERTEETPAEADSTTGPEVEGAVAEVPPGATMPGKAVEVVDRSLEPPAVPQEPQRVVTGAAAPSEAPSGEPPSPVRDEIPLPTATLARLALEQGDLPLAERTARAVLDRDPGSTEAREILEAVEERRPMEDREPPGVIHRKIDRLEGWLARIRGGSAARTL